MTPDDTITTSTPTHDRVNHTFQTTEGGRRCIAQTDPLDEGYLCNLLEEEHPTLAELVLRPGPWNDISASYDAEPGSILLAQLTVLGVPMHLGAIRVTDDDDQQRPVTEADAVVAELEHVYGIHDMGLQTAEIPGYDGVFVLYAVPHGA